MSILGANSHIATADSPDLIRTIRAAAVGTASYVASTAVDLDQFGSITLRCLTAVPNAETFSIKPQWSSDNTNWSDERVLSGTTSGTERLETPLSRVIQLDATAANEYVERFNRLARWYRVVVKSTGTTATLAMTATALNN